MSQLWRNYDFVYAQQREGASKSQLPNNPEITAKIKSLAESRNQYRLEGILRLDY